VVVRSGGGKEGERSALRTVHARARARARASSAMRTVLMVAEKPSLALSIAKILSKGRRASL